MSARAELLATREAARLSKREARTLTNEVKRDLEALWEKCLRLYEGEAHRALGYSSWAAYIEAEFGRKKSQAYRMLDAARVIRALPDSPNGERPNEAQARELVPLLEDEEELLAVWREAQAVAEKNGWKLSADLVRQTVDSHLAFAEGKGPRRTRKRVPGSATDPSWRPKAELLPLDRIPGALAAHDRAQGWKQRRRRSRRRPAAEPGRRAGRSRSPTRPSPGPSMC
jgi:hypothetical protein